MTLLVKDKEALERSAELLVENRLEVGPHTIELVVEDDVGRKSAVFVWKFTVVRLIT